MLIFVHFGSLETKKIARHLAGGYQEVEATRSACINTPVMHAPENFDVLQLGVTFQPFERIACEKAILTLVTPGMERYARNFLDALFTNGNVDDAQVIVLALNSNEKIKELAAQFPQARFLEGSVDPIHYKPYLKSILYSSHYFVDAKHYVTLDIDTLTLESLQPFFEIMAMHGEDMVFCIEDQWGYQFKNLEGAFKQMYLGDSEVWDAWDLPQEDRSYTFIINDGVMAANRKGMESICERIDALPDPIKEWGRSPYLGIRNQFVFNLFLARYPSVQELDRSFNTMLNYNDDVAIWREGKNIKAQVGKLPIKILHVTSDKNKTRDYPLYDAFYEYMRSNGPTPDAERWAAFQDLWNIHQIALGAQESPERHRACHDIALQQKARSAFFLEEKDPLVIAAVAAAVEKDVWGLTQKPLEDWKRYWNLLPRAINSRIQIDARATRKGIVALAKNEKTFDLVFVQNEPDSAHLGQKLRWARHILAPEGAIVLQHTADNMALVQEVLAECGLRVAASHDTCLLVKPAETVDSLKGTPQQRPARPVTVGIVPRDDRAYANVVFTRSLQQQDFDPAHVRVLVMAPANSPQSLAYFQNWAAENGQYADVQVIASAHGAADPAPLFQEILEAYLRLSSDAGLMLWDPRMDWSPNTLRDLCNSPHEITQGLYIADAAKNTWSVLNWEAKEQRSAIATLEDLYYQDEVSCACLGGFFMSRSLWERFHGEHGGWNGLKSTESLLATLQRNAALLRSVTAWHYTDDRHAVTLVFKDLEKKPRLYQKRPGPPPPPPIEEPEEDAPLEF